MHSRPAARSASACNRARTRDRVAATAEKLLQDLLAIGRPCPPLGRTARDEAKLAMLAESLPPFARARARNLVSHHAHAMHRPVRPRGVQPHLSLPGRL